MLQIKSIILPKAPKVAAMLPHRKSLTKMSRTRFGSAERLRRMIKLLLRKYWSGQITGTADSREPRAGTKITVEVSLERECQYSVIFNFIGCLAKDTCHIDDDRRRRCMAANLAHGILLVAALSRRAIRLEDTHNQIPERTVRTISRLRFSV